MNAAGTGRRHTLIGVQLTIAGLLLLSVTGCNSRAKENFSAAPAPAAPGPTKVFANGADTPIVIAGGSIHFRAKHNTDWAACPGTNATCYMAVFTQTQKKNTNNYQVFNDYDLNAVPVASVTHGWEIDVWDTNPNNNPSQPMQHGVLVCAESSAPYTSCNPGVFSSDSIYVIAVGGTFALPDLTNHKKILYHDGADRKYDDINNIVLNAGTTSATNEPCTKSRCAVFFSQ